MIILTAKFAVCGVVDLSQLKEIICDNPPDFIIEKALQMQTQVAVCRNSFVGIPQEQARVAMALSQSQAGLPKNQL